MQRHNTDAQDVTDGGGSPDPLAPDEIAAEPPATARSTQAPTPAATGNMEPRAPAGAENCREIYRRVMHELREDKHHGTGHPVWEYFSVYVEEAFK